MQTKTKILLVYLISLVSTYDFEVSINHTPLDKYPDYLQLFMGEENNSKVVLYALPMKLKHRESFVLRICKKGTIKNFRNEKNINLLDENCVDDAYNSLMMSDYINKKHHSNPVFNLYKICNFGFGYPEAEKAYVNANEEFFDEEKSFGQDQDMFYKDSIHIYMIYEESIKMEYRKMFVERPEFKCGMTFRTKQNMKNSDLFIPQIHFERRQHDVSQLLIEYDFQEEQFKDEDLTNQEFLEPIAVDKVQFAKTRSDIMKKLEGTMIFNKNDFKNLNLEIQIMPGEDSKLQMNMQSRPGQEIILPTEIQSGRYLRFVPMICLKVADTNEGEDFAFMGESTCHLMSLNKSLLARDPQNGLNFVTKEGASTNLSYTVDVLDLEFYHKNQPEKVYVINHIEDFCDTLYDKKLSTLFFVCYQQLQNIVNGKEVGYLQRKKQPINFELNLNQFQNGRKLMSKGGMTVFFILDIVGIVGSCVMLGLLASSGSMMWFPLVALLIFIVMFVVLCYECNSRQNYGGYERLLKKLRILPKSDKSKNFKVNVERIKNLSSLIPNLFVQSGKGNSVMMITELETLKNENTKFLNSETIVEHQQNHENVIDIHLSENSIIKSEDLAAWIQKNNPSEVIEVHNKDVKINSQNIKRIIQHPFILLQKQFQFLQICKKFCIIFI